MKRMILFALGLTPFLFGGLLNRAMMTIFYNTSLPLFLIGLAALFIWFIFAYRFGRYANDSKQAILFLNFPALLVLILVGFQELVLHSYWFNFVGMWTQMFYLPLINIGSTLTSWSHDVFPAYCVGFALMVAVSSFGCRLHQKRNITN